MSIKRFLKAFSCAVGLIAIGICTVGAIESLPPNIKRVVIVVVFFGLVIGGLTWSFYQDFDD